MQRANFYKTGYDAGSKYASGVLRDYRIVIALRNTGSAGQDDFLKGFSAAFADIGQRENGEKYAGILRDANKERAFDTAKGKGELHAMGSVTDEGIQQLIMQSVNSGQSVALAWEAGYIEGFKNGLQNSGERTGKTVDELYPLISL